MVRVISYPLLVLLDEYSDNLAELKEIPKRFREEGIDLMLIHLGGTVSRFEPRTDAYIDISRIKTIPSPSVPLLMVTMDAKQGVEVMRLFGSSLDLTIPIHFDDYDVFLSPLDDFKEAVEEAGMQKKVVYLDRGDAFRFEVRK